MPDRADWIRLALVCVIGLLLLAVGAGAGALWMQRHNADRLAAAKSATDVCASASQAQRAVIDKMRDAAQANQRQLDAARAVAQAAMQARDALQQQLTDQARQRRQHLEEVAHDHVDCTALAGLPLCPAVAHSLFDPTDPRGHAAGGDHRDP